MTSNELFYFAGKCLALDEHPEFKAEIIRHIADESINWQDFTELCSNHLILPAIYLKFRIHEILSHIPEDLSDFLTEIHGLNLIRNEQIMRQIGEIVGILNASNISPTILKGAGNLLDGLYSNAGERIMGDIDFLVPENCYLLAAKLMKDAGYCTYSEIPDYNDVNNMKHYPRLHHPEFSAAIEIHRIPVKDNYLGWFNTDVIDLEKKVPLTINGCFVESDNHKIVHNFIHSQLSNQGHLSGIVSLRDLYDIYLLSKRSDLNDSIIHIKTKQKAIAYFVFAGNALGIEEQFPFKHNLAYWMFSKRHSLNMSSNTFYRTYRNVLFFRERIFTKYISQLIISIYSAEIRQSLFGRLSDRNWYKSHFRLYKSFFFPNK